MLTYQEPHCTRATWGFESHLGRSLRTAAFACIALAGVAVPRTAHAQAATPVTTAGIHNMFVAVGPVAAAVHGSAGWNGAFGGEVLFGRMDEAASIALAAVSVGAADVSEGDRGRMWADVALGTRRLFGVTGGVSAGVTVDIHPVEPPDFGLHASLWLYAGIVPYVGIGRVAGETSLELGFRIPLPVKTW